MGTLSGVCDMYDSWYVLVYSFLAASCGYQRILQAASRNHARACQDKRLLGDSWCRLLLYFVWCVVFVDRFGPSRCGGVRLCFLERMVRRQFVACHTFLRSELYITHRKYQKHQMYIACLDDNTYITATAKTNSFTIYIGKTKTVDHEIDENEKQIHIQCMAATRVKKTIKIAVGMGNSTSGHILIYTYADNTLVNAKYECGSFVGSLAFSQDGLMLVAGTSSNTTIYYNDYKEKIYLKANQYAQTTAVAFSPVGSMLATAGTHVISDGPTHKINIYNIESIESISSESEWEYENEVNSICFSPDALMLATGEGSYNKPGKTTIYDVENKSQICQWVHEGPVSSVCFSPDALMLVAGDYAGCIYIYTDEASETISRFQHTLKIEDASLPLPVSSVCFSPNGTIFAAVGDQLKKYEKVVDNTTFRYEKNMLSCITLRF